VALLEIIIRSRATSTQVLALLQTFGSWLHILMVDESDGTLLVHLNIKDF